MAKKRSIPTAQIVVNTCHSWSSSFSRTMNTVGRSASAAAIQHAAKNGTQISYLKDGIVVKNTIKPQEAE